MSHPEFGKAYKLLLFIADNEPNSRLARANLARFCEKELHGRCEVEIIDVLEDSAAAVTHNVLVTPTLVIQKPEPSVMVIGNLNDREKLCAALRLGGA